MRRKVRMYFLLSAIMSVVFSAYFIAIAWLPGWMGSIPLADSSVTVGIWFTEVPKSAISETQVLMTVVHGNVVHDQRGVDPG